MLALIILTLNNSRVLAYSACEAACDAAYTGRMTLCLSKLGFDLARCSYAFGKGSDGSKENEDCIDRAMERYDDSEADADARYNLCMVPCPKE